ncbi:uncharacterized protein PHALS_10001 [Plasmopara halstedii]|uniref:Uncharacterized protein n=1 Tax=Plasmopara halstedii TaxID=4781 RepID=A0A0P1AGG5_PLAHL|nr:uncharacterized protein PHALS_10001 [Plasmopara halstedii]CEG39765.1 hypothetical protein PHALS_10001 [Plasmopara halstedii]|eukprot:XP_024576134.1 hypothetical protein PHALS_10001 [Plasmopara halstedii]
MNLNFKATECLSVFMPCFTKRSYFFAKYDALTQCVGAYRSYAADAPTRFFGYYSLPPWVQLYRSSAADLSNLISNALSNDRQTLPYGTHLDSENSRRTSSGFE